MRDEFTYDDSRKCKCDNCGKEVPIELLDAKPERMAGRGNLIERLFPSLRRRKLSDAMWENEDFDRLECKDCYGPGYTAGVLPIYALRG